jgi:hypothetical protein
MRKYAFLRRFLAISHFGNSFAVRFDLTFSFALRLPLLCDLCRLIAHETEVKSALGRLESPYKVHGAQTASAGLY